MEMIFEFCSLISYPSYPFSFPSYGPSHPRVLQAIPSNVPRSTLHPLLEVPSFSAIPPPSFQSTLRFPLSYDVLLGAIATPPAADLIRDLAP
jgi:hypothetical protein